MKQDKQCASHILMIKPVNFFFNKETTDSNVFQKKSELSNNELKKIILNEFEEAIEIIENMGVSINLIDPLLENNIPDQVFPNNWFQVTHDGNLILFPLQSNNRRKERQLYIIDQIKNHYQISDVIDLSNYETNNLFLEGTGSVVLDHNARTAYAVHSSRTSEEVFKKYCNIIDYKDVLFNAYDENGTPVYHTNVLMSIGPGFSVICLDLIPKVERKSVSVSLIANKLEIIEIEENQMMNFCGNILTLLSENGEYLVVMSERAKLAFRKEQLRVISKYAKIISVPINHIESIGGGGIRCMMAEIFSI